MKRIKAYEVQEGMRLVTRLGNYTVLRIDPYKGGSKNIINVLVFDIGFILENNKNRVYGLINN